MEGEAIARGQAHDRNPHSHRAALLKSGYSFGSQMSDSEATVVG